MRWAEQTSQSAMTILFYLLINDVFGWCSAPGRGECRAQGRAWGLVRGTEPGTMCVA